MSSCFSSAYHWSSITISVCVAAPFITPQSYEVIKNSTPTLHIEKWIIEILTDTLPLESFLGHSPQLPQCISIWSKWRKNGPSQQKRKGTYKIQESVNVRQNCFTCFCERKHVANYVKTHYHSRTDSWFQKYPIFKYEKKTNLSNDEMWTCLPWDVQCSKSSKLSIALTYAIICMDSCGEMVTEKNS